MSSPPRKGRLRRKLALLVLSMVIVDQALQWTVLRDGLFLKQPIAPFEPPIFTDRQQRLLDEYVARLDNPQAFERRSLFDAELGWCPKPGMRRNGRSYDWSGSRIGLRPLPRQRSAAKRIALVGCSFTEGLEVESHESWAARLEEMHPELEVANLGFGGFGMDQAYLRAMRDALPLEPDEVWLGLFPSGVLRTSTHFSPVHLHWHARGVLFKPRLRATRDLGLEVIPSPAKTPEDIPRLLADQTAFFEAMQTDHWVARVPGAYAPRGSRWLHRSGFGRLFLTFLEAGGRDSTPFLRDRESDIYRLHLALILDLHETLQAQGRILRVLVLPGSPDLEARREGAPWADLIAEVEAAGITTLDPSDGLTGEGLWQPEGHYSPRANRIVAEAISAGWLSE